jgi:hypothetical protein
MRIATTVMVATLALAGCGGGGDEGPGTAQATSDGGSGAGGLPDGEYLCSYLSGGMLMTLGTVTIRGDRYAGFSGGRFTPYSRAADDTLDFPAGFVGVPDGFEVVQSRWKASENTGDQYIEIKYGSPTGWAGYWTCRTQ